MLQSPLHCNIASLPCKLYGDQSAVNTGAPSLRPLLHSPLHGKCYRVDILLQCKSCRLQSVVPTADVFLMAHAAMAPMHGNLFSVNTLLQCKLYDILSVVTKAAASLTPHVAVSW